MRILEVGKQFRPYTSVIYPPFKHGRYLEEYAYDYFCTHPFPEINAVYIPVFWTSLQNHPGFSQMRSTYNIMLQRALNEHPAATFFTVVQHDDGPMLDLPPNTIVFGACSGTIPIPLIYEDTQDTLVQTQGCAKEYLASFVGSMTHPVRDAMCSSLSPYPDIMCQGKKGWSSYVSATLAEQFISVTVRSKFCLAPRGYGRSSFRFFEAIQLNVIPVYIWDDVCWLPYQDSIPYDTFSVCIHVKEMDRLHDILTAISDETYEAMIAALQNVRKWFTLEHMCTYITDRLLLSDT